MADEDYADGYFFDDDDYLYVEDDYAIADELAETQCPSPGYSGAHGEVQLEGYEYDVYEYFGELEYGQDEYWDSSMKHLDQTQKVGMAGGKRKREDKAPQSAKRRKVAQRSEEGENVVFRSFGKQVPVLPPKLHVREGTEFALLPDWRERFESDSQRMPVERGMPADMREAAEAATEDDARGEEEGDWEDEEEEEEGDGDVQDALAGLDPDTLKAILKQKLSETGLGGMDEGAFEQAIAKMLSGSSDDAAGDLTELLLGRATEGGDTAVSGWLSGQGVRLDGDEGKEGSAEGMTVRTSPLDSAVGEASGRRKGSKLSQVVTIDPAELEESGLVVADAAETANDAAVAIDAATTSDEPALASTSRRKRKLGVADESAGLESSRRGQAARDELELDAERSTTHTRASKRSKTAAAKGGR